MNRTQRYRVKLNCLLPHDGEVLTGGTDVELRPDIAHEVRHLVDEVLPTGEVQPIGFKDRQAAQLAADLAAARPHERISLLERARAAVADDLKTLDAQIAAEQTRLEADAKKTAPADSKAADTKKTAPADSK